MKITGSSAIAEINFTDSNEVGVQFTSQDKEYKFISSDVDALRSELESTLNKNESVGRLIAGYRASGKLTQV